MKSRSREAYEGGLCQPGRRNTLDKGSQWWRSWERARGEMSAPLAKITELWGDAGFAMEVELPEVISSWLGSVNDRMI